MKRVKNLTIKELFNEIASGSAIIDGLLYRRQDIKQLRELALIVQYIHRLRHHPSQMRESIIKEAVALSDKILYDNPS
jgi:hypothetical protein